MVSPKKAALIAAIAALGVVAGDAALARGFAHHGGHVRFGLFVGAPAYWGGYWGPYYYPPYYYPPTVMTVPVSPPTYIEQAPAAAPAAPAPQSGYWYYCAGSRAYYPYVNQCPGGWQRVSPQPPTG